MAFGLFTKIRNNWKKSIFFFTTANVALWYTYDNYITNEFMRTCCRRVALLGDAKLISFDAQPRHVTVILNPIAGKRKSKKLYQKWVEPLLHLAGIKVSLIETETPNQAYELMKIMSNCDGVAIVGGDGTINEAVNGLLHRPDCVKATHDFPIGIIPTGQNNSIASYVHQNLSYRNQKELLIQSTLSLIDSHTKKYDVLKIEPINQGSQGEPVFALRDVRYGKYQDIFVKNSGFLFYQTNVKPLWFRIQRAFSSKFPKPQLESISFTKPCIGCSRCYQRHKLNENQPRIVEDKSINRKWWSILAPMRKPIASPSEEDKKELELSKRNNPNCGEWIDYINVGDITDLRICSMGNKRIGLSLSINGEYSPSKFIESQDVKFKVPSDLDNERRVIIQSKQQLLNPTVDESSPSDGNDKSDENEEKNITKKFLIDGQPTEVHSIQITALNKPVTIFTKSVSELV